ncbi:PilZ domain-containing protein [Catenovulum adriaticum]|uniref:Cyclic diguanosine monophosphate-binding protein n=1 Tax=Catenovulum adriaticum TaxID=2984846 RepID=A0ABY7ARJ6_9ALTE|nr:PilZ domain-containing protein [Catenovulum sp. TS8]WAJ71110.1 PilZ domain-containing protein [Catenovulum sp. TS8]
MTERRHYTRIIFANDAVLSNGHYNWTVKLIDLSLNGALISHPDQVLPSQLNHQDSFNLTFTLPQSDNVSVQMSVKIVHVEPEVLGLRCEKMDIDSATHLRRIVELNMASEDLLMRELEHLIEQKI